MFRSKSSLILFIILGLSFFLLGFQVKRSSVQEEVDRINREIQQQGLKWKAGITSMTLLSPQERRLRLGAVVPLYDDPEKFVKLEERMEIQAVLDWRIKDGGNYMTSVKNQGSCGSCWAFAVVGTMEATYNVENGISETMPAPLGKKVSQIEKYIDNSRRRLGFSTRTLNRPNEISILALQLPNFSEQDLVSCSGAGTCAGGSPDSAANYAKNNGIVSEDCFPYTAHDDPCVLCSDWVDKLSRINGFGWVTQSWLDNAAVKAALQVGPLSCYMDVYDDFYSYLGGIYEPIGGANLEGGHVVVLVGYSEEENYWICKNSWGTWWGEQGYFKIRMGACKTGQWVLRIWGVSAINQPPELFEIDVSGQTFKEGKEISIQVEGSDPDDDPLVYAASPLPDRAHFDTSTGLFTWTPSYTQAGQHTIRFSVSDGIFEDSQVVTIVVLNVKRAKRRF